MNKTLVVIAGPTAVGKTAISIQLAQQLNTSIISADSRQCYQGLRIGAACPTDEELDLVPHFFIQAYPISQALSAADFEQIALQHLDEIFQKNNKAIVCGGTGLYIKALCEGLDEMPKVDVAITNDVQVNFENQGLAWLQEKTKKEDPIFYEQIDVSNAARLLRGLTFKLSTGRSITAFQQGQKKERPFRIVKIMLDLPRPVLYERINQRVDKMMELGLLEEAKLLYPFRQLKNLQTVGYSELFEYFDGNWTLDFAVDKIKQHSRNYAKRQLTWFKKDADFIWLESDKSDVVAQIKNLLT